MKLPQLRLLQLLMALLQPVVVAQKLYGHQRCEIYWAAFCQGKDNANRMTSSSDVFTRTSLRPIKP
jgi:hypothetical protein